MYHYHVYTIVIIFKRLLLNTRHRINDNHYIICNSDGILESKFDSPTRKIKIMNKEYDKLLVDNNNKIQNKKKTIVLVTDNIQH